MNPRQMVCQGCCSSARKDKHYSKPRQHSGANISQASGEFKSKLAASAKGIGARWHPRHGP